MSVSIGIIAYIVKLSYDYSKLKTRFENNEKRDNEEREADSKKFEALYNFQNGIDKTLIGITSTLNGISKNVEDDKKSNEKKFNELFNSRNKTNDTLTELTTTLKMMLDSIDSKFKSIDVQFQNLDKKIDELKRG